MEFELETGYKLLITKFGKNKKYRLCCSHEPYSKMYFEIGRLDKLGIEMLEKAFSVKPTNKWIDQNLGMDKNYWRKKMKNN